MKCYKLLLISALSVVSGCIDADEVMGPVTFSSVSPSEVADGSYTGEYRNVGYAKVQVDVASGRIEQIKLVEHESSFVGRRAEVITERVIHAQSLAVDAVSGATVSSRVILKAIDSALVQGVQQ